MGQKSILFELFNFFGLTHILSSAFDSQAPHQLKVEGAIIKLTKNFCRISLLNENTIIAGSGALDKTLSELQYRGNHNFEDLKDQDERTRYYRQFAAEMNLHNISILYSDLIQLDAKNYLKNQLGLFPGMRKMYRESMIRHQLPTNFVKICDEIVKEIELEVGEDGQITDLTRSDIKK